ncbi:MAG: type II toxin-antitoxin system death-on-curing family toxin [Candidatus Riflebacteria bacterium]|nr:type II toxin-antitoxin system death-on-curing family toxin [Candidatus Riflebacteria bacterium]
MKRLSKKQILMLHSQLIKATGGSKEIRDEGLLESAITMPFQSFSREDLYPSIEAKAARLCYGLVKNHAFVDGNKRIGVHSMLVFLAINDYELKYSQKELYTIILNVASGKKDDKDLLKWIKQHKSKV